MTREKTDSEKIAFWQSYANQMKAYVMALTRDRAQRSYFAWGIFFRWG